MTESSLPLADSLAKAGDEDFLRSVAEAVVQLLMETDVEGLVGAGRHEQDHRAGDLSPRLSRSHAAYPAGHPAGRPAAADPQAAAGQLLPALPGYPKDVGEGAGGGDPGGVDRRRFHPPCGRPDAGDGTVGHQQKHSLQAVQGHR